MIAALFLCTAIANYDGDTLTCREGQKVRLAAVDAPEIRGCHGRRGRICVPGDGQASKRALAGMIAGKTLRCEKVGMSYQRTVAWCAADGRDLSCQMMRQGFAAYVPRYDARRRICR